jgi:uncharacterized Zn-binding protein involved in type VI secretion
MFAPAARLTDMHVCPMFNGPVPHVGGPILPPCHPTTLIAALPAARISDMAFCAGPPDVIATGSFTVFIGGMPAARLGDTCAHGGKIVVGCPTVLIGDSGSGSGAGAAGVSGGNSNAAGSSTVQAATHPFVATMLDARTSGTPFVETRCAEKAVQARLDRSPMLATGDPNKKSWIEIRLVDDDGSPVAYELYRVVTPDGVVREGFLNGDGLARVDGIDPGTCSITFPNRDADAWDVA